MNPVQPLSGASCSYQDFVGFSAAIQVYGEETAFRVTGVSPSDWAEVTAHWTAQIAGDAQRFASHPQALAQEEQRIRGGGQPRYMQLTQSRVAAPAPAAPPPAPAAPPPAAAPSAGLAVGGRVLVAWSDGNQYPGQLTQVAPGQVLVRFEDGSQQWAPESSVRPV